MIHFTSDKLSKKQQYKFLSGSIIPRPIAWITTLTADGKTVNLAPFSFFSGVSNELPLLSIAILRQNGEMKDSARNLLATKEAVIHIVDESLIHAMNQTSRSLAPDQSEVELTNLTLEPSLSVQVPGISEAKIRFETTLHHYVPIKNQQDQIVTDLFILAVSDFHFSESVFDQKNDYILTEKLLPVARLAGNKYATLADEYTVKRPK
ncbi:flavin reductase family protein [Carnobacterium maltaromaticum]|uniref:flavin reductase family protein n=1 Tax=Carnobacterium maltaromaticum TaxID=2751 RepID=UPI00298A8A78|nr:flavin reductase family protein [Carnobacterium maltaromaticum]MDW5523488.1 flavin reductase family protein [Carnobacterium maltaromaticum]